MTPPACLASLPTSRLLELTAGPHSITGTTGRSPSFTDARNVNDVRRRIEPELFHRLKSGAVVVFEDQGRRRRGGCVGGRALDFVQSAVQCFRRSVVGNAERERQRLRAPELAGDQLQGLSLLVPIVLEAPALETRAAVREDGDHLVGLDADVALGRGSYQGGAVGVAAAAAADSAAAGADGSRGCRMRRAQSTQGSRAAPDSMPAQTATGTCTAPGTTRRWRGELVFPFIFGRPGPGYCCYRADLQARSQGETRPVRGTGSKPDGAKRMTAREPSRGEPRAPHHAVPNHGLPGEVRTRR